MCQLRPSSAAAPPPTDRQRGWSQVSWALSTPQAPTLTLCSRPASSASILSFILSFRETVERSIQPSEKPGVGEGATSLLPSISKVWGQAPTPASLACTPHGGPGAPAGGGSPSALTHPPTPTSRPHDWHPSFHSHPNGCEDRTDHTCFPFDLI